MTERNQATKRTIESAENIEWFEFQHGIPGFPEYKKFMLRSLKPGLYDPLQILVSLDNPAMSFILYPHPLEAPFLTQTEKFELTAGHEEDKIGIYSIVTVQEPNGHLHLTTNLKAPIVLDHDTHMGWQQILSTKDKPLHFPLTDLSNQLQQQRLKK